MTRAYDELGEAEQVEVLRGVALRAAAAFGLEVEGMALALHGYNTTFRVDGRDGRRLALRVGTNSHSTPEHAVAQQAWLGAIAAETDVRVPEPLRTPDGGWLVSVDAEELGRAVLVTMASWLEGPDAEVLEPDSARALGRTMAALHAQAAGWAPPPGGALPRLDAPLFGDLDVLDDAPGLTADDRSVLDTARSRATEVFDRLHRGAQVRPLHADLHGGNLKWHERRLSVFDFDDAGLGLPVLDLAISAFYLRGGDPALEVALREGYAEVAPLPEADQADVEALIASRQLLLANALLVSTTAEHRAQAADYTGVALARLRHWLASGRFSLDPGGG